MQALLKKLMHKGNQRMTHPMSDISSSQDNEQGIENAEAVIERFGGIRPMAKKVDVAVTTVQGWKKRNVIPGPRREQVIEAARIHNIDLSDILDGKNAIPAANENLPRAQSYSAIAAEAQAADNAASSHASVPEVKVEVKAQASDAPVPSFVAEIPAFEQKLAETEKRAVKKSTWINILLLLIGLAAVVVLLLPKASQNNDVRISTLESDVGQLRGDVDAVKAEQSFLSTIIPKDLDKRIADLQAQAQQAQANLGQALEKVGEISSDVMNQDTMSRSVQALGAHVTEITGSPEIQALMQRIQSMSASLAGQEKLNQAVAELSALTSAPQSTPFEETLVAARAQSSSLGETFADVPAQDLKAAALLLGMAQFRQSLNRDNTPFEDDLQLLKNLVSEDNAELAASLDRLAPSAQQGVLTPAGLTTEFRTMAGDAVVASLKGEDVSVQEKAKARLNQIFNVEKNDEMITGTPEQIKMAKAEKLLKDGDIENAIAQVETLDGAAAEVAAPWLAQARATLTAEKLKSYLNTAMDEVSKGRSVLIRNEETGINILRPAPSAPSTTNIYQ
jgi:hypothetical protein